MRKSTYPESFNEIEAWLEHLRRAYSPAQVIHAIDDRIGQESNPERLRILNSFLAKEHLAQGNNAAAEAVWANDPVDEVYRWYAEWDEEESSAVVVAAIKDRIGRETNSLKVSILRGFLAQEYRDEGDYASATAAYLDDFNADPREMPLITLANQKFYDENQPEEAVPIIAQAVEVALRSGTFRRLALGTQARLALHIQDYRLVEHVLRTLLNLKFTRGNADINVERDFFDALPPGSVDPEVARQYDEHCRMRGKLPGADTPKGRPSEDKPS